MEVTMKLLDRRKEALALLRKQLAGGIKNNNPKKRVDGKTITQQRKDNPTVRLSPKDVRRIEKEIDNLEFKILNTTNENTPDFC